MAAPRPALLASPAAPVMSSLDVLDAHYDHVASLEKEASSAVTQISDALVNLLQARPEHIHPGPMTAGLTGNEP